MRIYYPSFQGRILTQNSAAASRSFSMPELQTEGRSFRSAGANTPSWFPAPPPSRSDLTQEKANEVTISQCPCTSKSNVSVKPLKSILRKNPTTTKKAKSVSFALPSSTEELECVAKTKSAGAKLCGKNSSKTTRQQSKSKDKSSLTTVNKARSAFATSDRVVTTLLKPARSEGSQQMSKSVTGPRLMPRRSRSSPIKLEALKPQDEMKSVPSLPSITSEDMLMQHTSALEPKKAFIRSFRRTEKRDSQCTPIIRNKTFSYPLRPVTLPKVCTLPKITDVSKKTMKAHLQPQPSYTK